MPTITRLTRSPALTMSSSTSGRVSPLGIWGNPPKANRVTLCSGMPRLMARKFKITSRKPTAIKKSRLEAIPRMARCQTG